MNGRDKEMKRRERSILKMIRYAKSLKGTQATYLKSLIIDNFEEENFFEVINNALKKQHSVYNATLEWCGYKTEKFVPLNKRKGI